MSNQLKEEKCHELLALVQKEEGVSDSIKTKMISLINDYANKNNPDELKTASSNLRKQMRIVSGRNDAVWANRASILAAFFTLGLSVSSKEKPVKMLSKEEVAKKLPTVNNDSPAISLYLKMKPILKSLAKSTEQDCEEQSQDTARLIR